MKNEAFAWDFPQELELEDVKTKLSCETPLKNWKLTMWKQSFRESSLLWDFFAVGLQWLPKVRNTEVKDP